MQPPSVAGSVVLLSAGSASVSRKTTSTGTEPPDNPRAHQGKTMRRQACVEALFLFVRDRGGRRALDPAIVVPRDPRTYLAFGQEYLSGDVGCGVAEGGQPDRGQSADHLGPWLG